MVLPLDPESDDDIFTKHQAPSGARVLLSPPPDHLPIAPATSDWNAHGSQAWNGPAGWSVYFPGESESDGSCAGRAAVVKCLAAYFQTEPGQKYLSTIPSDSFALPLDFSQLSRRSSPSVLRSLAATIQDTPEEALACMGIAACRAAERLATAPGAAFSVTDMPVERENRLWPRVYQFSPVTALRELRGNVVGKFVSVKGTVVRVSSIRQQLLSMDFECSRCGERQSRNFADYKYSVPSKCPGERCRARSFAPIRETAETVDWQKIRIQELQDKCDDASMREEGRMPRTIDAELFSDLIDTCIPGDIVTVCGIVRVLSIDGGGYNRGSKCLFYVYIEANSTTSTRNRNSSREASSIPAGRGAEESGALAIHRVIREVVREKDPFGFLVHSAVPSIYGHEIVKAGALLSLFGGSPKERVGPSGSESVSIRRDIHCLIVGDPGLGKSQMLKAFSNIAPRGVYVCGNTTSTAGLTVTVVREASGDFALEAGALVLGDRGICCIDEFDKMGAEHGALLEAMEQQSVSVAKAGLLCNLSARTTVIAAANPVGGHYDRSRTVCENLKIALPLLSRFDLVFILMDKADEARDRFISEHVMQMFGMRSSTRPTGAAWRKEGHVPTRESSHSQASTTSSLQARLRGCRVKDPLPPSLFREYIAYARTHVHPELSEAARRELQDFYLLLRKSAHEQTVDSTPVTTRQLESLVRLCEARARCVMRTVVTRDDARDVIEIMRESMIETLTDEAGTLDLGRASGMSRVQDARRFVTAMHAEAKRVRTAVFRKARLVEIAGGLGVEGERFERLLETVNHQGFLIRKGGGRWEVQGSAFADAGRMQSGAGTQAHKNTPGRMGTQLRQERLTGSQSLAGSQARKFNTQGGSRAPGTSQLPDMSQGVSQYSRERREAGYVHEKDSSDDYYE